MTRDEYLRQKHAQSAALHLHTLETIQRMVAEDQVINFTTVAEAAGVSQSYLHRHKDVSELIVLARESAMRRAQYIRQAAGKDSSNNPEAIAQA